MTQVSTSYSNIMDRYRNMVSQTEGSMVQKAGLEEPSNPISGSFGDMISTQIEKLNGMQAQSDALVQDFAAGGTEDLHQVMIAAEEARLSMELAVQVRNKVIEAYKELNNMPL